MTRLLQLKCNTNMAAESTIVKSIGIFFNYYRSEIEFRVRFHILVLEVIIYGSTALPLLRSAA